MTAARCCLPTCGRSGVEAPLHVGMGECRTGAERWECLPKSGLAGQEMGKREWSVCRRKSRLSSPFLRCGMRRSEAWLADWRGGNRWHLSKYLCPTSSHSTPPPSTLPLPSSTFPVRKSNPPGSPHDSRASCAHESRGKHRQTTNKHHERWRMRVRRRNNNVMP